jgi:hypothetical protein
MTSDSASICGQVIAYSTFPELVGKHLQNVRRTIQLELAGVKLRQEVFTDEALRRLIEDVCLWGGRVGIAAHVYNDNRPEHVRSQFILALQILRQSPPDVSSALRCINAIKWLSTPSFASKHLRFLCPEFCPVLDSRIHDVFGYPFDVSGYHQYAEDCLQIALVLERIHSPNPRQRDHERWYVGDIDMALYARLKSW